MLQRLERLGELLGDGQREQLAELHRKIAAGEPVVLGPQQAYSCPHCNYRQEDAEFANGIIWRNDHAVTMAAHINQLHELEKSWQLENRQLRMLLAALEKRFKIFKEKRALKRPGRSGGKVRRR